MGKGLADPGGTIASVASVEAANQSYALGEQQLQWAKQVWAAEQPLIQQADQQQITASQAETATMALEDQFAMEQEQQYLQDYAPLEKAYLGQAENWASPGNTALVQGQAQANVAEQSNAALNTAEEQLRSYGINPGAPKYAGLMIGQQAIEGAGQAAVGTQAAQNLQLQQMGLEAGAINTGRGLVNANTSLTGTGTAAGQAGSQSAAGAANTAQQNLSTGASSAAASTAFTNAGTNAMNTYVNAINGYNQAQLGYSQLGAQETASAASGLGSLLGGSTLASGASGLGIFGIAKGGPVRKFAAGGNVGGDVSGSASPVPAIPTGGTPGGGVPIAASPSGGLASDDVDAKLTAGEFVIPKDVAMWKGHEHFQKLIDQARKGNDQFSKRDDIGGETIQATPNPNPAFVSRPALNTGSTAATQPALAINRQLPQPWQHPQYNRDDGGPIPSRPSIPGSMGPLTSRPGIPGNMRPPSVGPHTVIPGNISSPPLDFNTRAWANTPMSTHIEDRR
jgi:hypothetical protein